MKIVSLLPGMHPAAQVASYHPYNADKALWSSGGRFHCMYPYENSFQSDRQCWAATCVLKGSTNLIPRILLSWYVLCSHSGKYVPT